MNIFIDTEYTDILSPCLISIGMASEYGEEFYAEVPYPNHVCSEFTKEWVLPLLGRDPYAYFSLTNLHFEIIKWLEIVRRKNEDVCICVDSETDWHLFTKALNNRIPEWCSCRLIDNEIVELMLYDFFKDPAYTEHHALHDALANRHAYRSKAKPTR